MIWAIQDSLKFESLDRNVKPLVEALRSLGKKFVGIGVIPKFESGEYDPLADGYDPSELPKITGLDDLDITEPTFFYGSTLLAELGATNGFKPGSFYKPEWWDPSIWSKNRHDMLNDETMIITVQDMRNNWIHSPTFIKPVDPKKFSGMVIELDEKEWWLDAHTHLSGDLKISASPVKKICREWRFFIIKGKVVTGSLYKRYGCLVTREKIPDDIYIHAQSLASEWLPFDTIVMDICELDSGEIKVVEFNSMSSSGFYNSDIQKIVLAIEEAYD